uniref:Tyrosinase copper-binding domain-containing protein n=1 Tax=Acanthochromis polyacanthus TaxID=80966 RepID=A0A3Q1F506_9TELE
IATSLLLKFYFSVEAQFPRPCMTPENGSPSGFSSVLPKPVDYWVDWPRVFYDSVCTCWGNYDGYDCNQCLPGWTGQCLQSNDTTVEGNYVFHNTNVYDLYVWMHYYSAKSSAGSENNAAHRAPAFIFWHRVFLLFIEGEMRELTGNQDFYIPYWDWTRTNHCNICTNEYFGGVGQDGLIDSTSLFSKWKVRCPSQSLPDNPVYKTLPIAANAEDTMATALFDTPPFDKTSWNSFRNKLEGRFNSKTGQILEWHNVPTAANDPIFTLHHTFIDKLLETWLQDHGEATYHDTDHVHPAQRAQAYMAPFFPLRTNNYYWGRDTQSLGYNYKEHSLSHSAARNSGRRGAAGRHDCKNILNK